MLYLSTDRLYIFRLIGSPLTERSLQCNKDRIRAAVWQVNL